MPYPPRGSAGGGSVYEIYNKGTNSQPAVFTALTGAGSRDEYFATNPAELGDLNNQPFVVGIGTTAEDPSTVPVSGWWAYDDGAWVNVVGSLTGARGLPGDAATVANLTGRRVPVKSPDAEELIDSDMVEQSNGRLFVRSIDLANETVFLGSRLGLSDNVGGLGISDPVTGQSATVATADITDEGYDPLTRVRAKESETTVINASTDSNSPITAQTHPVRYISQMNSFIDEVTLEFDGEVDNLNITLQELHDGSYVNSYPLVDPVNYGFEEGIYIVDAMPSDPDPRRTYYLRNTSSGEVTIPVDHATFGRPYVVADGGPVFRLVFETTDTRGLRLRSRRFDLAPGVIGEQDVPVLSIVQHEFDDLPVADLQDVNRRYREINADLTMTSANDFDRIRNGRIVFTADATLTLGANGPWREGDSFEIAGDGGDGTLVITGFTVDGQASVSVEDGSRMTLIWDDDDSTDWRTVKQTAATTPDHPITLRRDMPDVNALMSLVRSSTGGNSAVWIIASDQLTNSNPNTGAMIRALSEGLRDADGDDLPTSPVDASTIRLRAGTIVRVFSVTDFRVVSTPGTSGDEAGSVQAANVQLSSAGITGLLQGAGNAQEAFSRIDATGLGAPITTFTGSYSADTANRDQWLNRHLQGADGQSCSRNRVVNLPDLTELNEAFDHLETLGLPETITITVSYFGCASTSSLVNSLRVNPSTNVDNAPGGFGFRNNVVLNRADSVTLQIERTGSTVGSWAMIARGQIASNTGDSLDDLEFQSRTWSNRDGSFLPGSDDVLKGYAFRVSASNPNDGTLRQGLVDAGVTDKVIYDGDWVVWTADSFTTWTDKDNWFVMPADDVRRITAQQGNFLKEVRESDADDYVRIADDSSTTEALVWLVNPDTPLTSAPFLEPSGTNSGNTDSRFTAGNYVGGRDARTSDNDFVFDLSTLSPGASIYEGEIVIGITNAFVNANNLNDMRLEIRESDGTLITSYNLNDNFVQPPTFNDLALDYSILSTFKLADSATELRYHSGQILSLRINRPDRSFTLTDNVKVGIDNIAGGHWGEDALSTDVRAKLNKESAITAQDRARLNGIEVMTGDIDIPANFPMQVRASSASYNDNHYRQLRVTDGLIQDFQETFTYTLRVDHTVEFTGFDFTGGRTRSGSVTLTEVTPSLFEGERTYTLVVPPAPDDITYDPLAHPIIPTGRAHPSTAVGLDPSIKVDAENFDQDFLDTILNHNQELPQALAAINRGAEVFHFDNTEFVSNNEHAGVASMFSFLKNRPDERQGDTPPANNNLVNEVTDSDITATIANVVGLFYPRTISGQFDNGVEVTTQGALTGPGSVNEPVTITSPSAANYRLVMGFWFDSDQIPENTIRNMVRVKERGTSSFRRLFGIQGISRINSRNQIENGMVITERVQGSPGTSSQVTVEHNIYTANGEINHTFSGVGASEVLFRVNEAREYTFESRLISNGNDEGSSTNSVTIADLNQNQNFGTHDFVYTVNGHSHTQRVTIEYVAASTTYGGPGHTLRFELLNGLADNSNFDIDHLIVSCHYSTQETVSTPASYAEANAGGTPLIRPRRKHRMIISFRKSASNDNLQAHYVVTGLDENSNPIVSSSNTVDFGYSVFDLDWSQVSLGNTNMFISQNIQGYFLNTDTPLAEFPTHAVLNGWISSHDDKATDYVWGNVSAPSRDVEAVRVLENVVMPNFLVPDDENNDRYRLTIQNGVLTPVKLV